MNAKHSFFNKKLFENAVCKMVAILFLCVIDILALFCPHCLLSVTIYLNSSDPGRYPAGFYLNFSHHPSEHPFSEYSDKYMMMSSNGIFSALLALCAGNSPVTREFPTQKPVTQSFDVFFDVCLNKRLSKQSRGWWLEMPSLSLWGHCNEILKSDVWTCSRLISWALLMKFL